MPFTHTHALKAYEVSRWRFVPTSGLYRDLPGDGQAREVVRFYNKPGTAEQWIKKGSRQLFFSVSSGDQKGSETRQLGVQFRLLGSP